MRGEPVNIKNMFTVSPVSNQKMSRYCNLRRLVNEDGVSYIESPVKMQVRESTKDSFYVVGAGFENRLDLISYKFYKTPFLWWVIASVNHIDNPMVVDVGIVLRIPSLSELYAPGGVLTSLRGDYK